jgi:hypothetical protein
MPNALPLPVRVLVKGPSLVNWTYPVGGPRTDFTIPRAIEAELLFDGRPCEVRAVTMMATMASDLLRTWEQEVLGYSPDVIILNYGGYESVHLFLPRWLERHVNSLRARPRFSRTIYRKLFLRPVWKLLARLQFRVDSKCPTVRKAPTRRLLADLERYITQVQLVGSPMVILMEINRATERRLNWFPGVNARSDIVNQAIAEMVARIDKPHIRYFKVMELVDKHFDGDIETAISDGFHFSPEMHRVIGAALAHEIGEWAETQPHLTRHLE